MIVRRDSSAHSLFKFLTLFLFFDDSQLVLLDELPVELSDLSVFESDVLFLPGSDVGRCAPDSVSPSILLRKGVSDDDVLVTKLLVASDTVLVVTLDLPVLIRVEVEQVIRFVLSLMVVRVMREHLEAPLRHLYLLGHNAVLDLRGTVGLDLLKWLLHALVYLQDDLAEVGLAEVGLLLDEVEHHAFPDSGYLPCDEVVLNLSHKELDLLEGREHSLLLTNQLDVFAGGNNLDSELPLNLQHCLQLSLHCLLHKGAYEGNLLSPVLLLLRLDQVFNRHFRILDVLAFPDVENFLLGECDEYFIFILNFSQIIQEFVKYALLHDWQVVSHGGELIELTSNRGQRYFYLRNMAGDPKLDVFLLGLIYVLCG